MDFAISGTLKPVKAGLVPLMYINEIPALCEVVLYKLYAGLYHAL
jgi:hypothetical protein